MSFISGALDKSVFNKGSYAAAIGKTDDKGSFHNGYAVVRIKPNQNRLGKKQINTEIKGVMDYSGGGLTFSIPSNWRDLEGVGSSLLPDVIKKIQGPYEAVNNIAQIGGAAQMGAAFASKLIYQQSGRLEINIPMMVVDWQGIGQPLMTAILLVNYCLPTTIGNMGDIATKFNEWLKQEFDKLQKSGKTAEEIAGYLGGALQNFAEGAVQSVENFVKEGLDKVASWDKTGTLSTAFSNFKETIADTSDLHTLRASPVPVNVQIGQFFKRDDMVIRNLSYTFSKEMTKAGPLYVKFNLELSSRKIMVGAQDCGLFLKGDQSRFMEASFT